MKFQITVLNIFLKATALKATQVNFKKKNNTRQVTATFKQINHIFF